MAFCILCNVPNREFYRLIERHEVLITFLAYHGIFKLEKQCPNCQIALTIDPERKEFLCQGNLIENESESKCNFRQSLFTDTFFEGTHLSIEEVCCFILVWLSRDPPPQQFLQDELGLSSDRVEDWSSLCQEVTMRWVEVNSQQIGGPGTVVEIGEAKVGKRKFNRGRLIEGQWVFGGIEQENKQKLFVVSVPNRSAETLLNVIKDNVLPGTIIFSDSWKEYDCLQHEGFNNLKVNLDITFVDPDTFSGQRKNQTIEHTWRDFKSKIPESSRNDEAAFGYISEFLFKRANPNHRMRLHNFFTQVGEMYTSEAV